MQCLVPAKRVSFYRKCCSETLVLAESACGLPGDAISLFLPEFTGGKACWGFAEGEPGSELRCVVAFEDGVGGVRPCVPCGSNCRFYRERDERGCLVAPRISFGVPEAADRRLLGQCACRNESADAFAQFSFEAPAGYGSACQPWDRGYQGVECPVLKPPSQISPWCCISWCFGELRLSSFWLARRRPGCAMSWH